MAVKASASITLRWERDIYATYLYYLLQSSTLSPPSKPTTNPPGGNWVLAEPTYSTGSTNSLYTVFLTVFTDDTFEYSEVSLSTSYEAAKEAYNTATTANTMANLANEAALAVENSVGEISETLSYYYLAKADLDPALAYQFGLTWDDSEAQYVDMNGTYYESIIAKIQADAESISEQYSSQSSIILQANIDDLNAALQETTELMNGQIRRGFIEVDGVKSFGIVISSRNVFSVSNTTWTPDGETNEYYEIDTGECFGLYTATGWQFWVGNQKLGWFDTSDGQLHVTSINIESDLQMHDWLFHEDGANFGIKYIGA